MDGFDFGWSLGLLEAVGVLAGSMLERAHGGEVGTRVAPFRSYVVLAGLLGMSSSLSNMALNYIKYPTKVRSTMKGEARDADAQRDRASNTLGSIFGLLG